MISGKMTSIDAVLTGRPRNGPKCNGCLEEKLEYLVFTRSMVAKEEANYYYSHPKGCLKF